MRNAVAAFLAVALCAPAVGQVTMREMLAAIADDTRRTAGHTGVQAIDGRVMAALAAVPREEFVPAGAEALAYVNRPQPIGHGQTISQPFIVALMTHLMNVQADARVLEIGTGSGYQAAVLAELVDEVYTIEIIPELARSATERLRRLGYGDVRVRTGDGWHGWPEAAPFDAIMVTAVGEDVPENLVRQLKPGGRLVLPVGTTWDQNLAVVSQDAAGNPSMRHVLPVRFVPLTREQ